MPNKEQEPKKTEKKVEVKDLEAQVLPQGGYAPGTEDNRYQPGSSIPNSRNVDDVLS